jgi:hypothetical protein
MRHERGQDLAASPFELGQRTSFVLLHQAAVTDHVGCHDRGKAALSAFFSHPGRRPPSLPTGPTAATGGSSKTSLMSITPSRFPWTMWCPKKPGPAHPLSDTRSAMATRAFGWTKTHGRCYIKPSCAIGGRSDAPCAAPGQMMHHLRGPAPRSCASLVDWPIEKLICIGQRRTRHRVNEPGRESGRAGAWSHRDRAKHGKPLARISTFLARRYCVSCFDGGHISGRIAAACLFPCSPC